MDNLEKLKELAKLHINLKGFTDGIIDEILEKALEKVVADSSNPFDDVMFQAVYPVLEGKLKEEIHQLIDKLYA